MRAAGADGSVIRPIAECRQEVGNGHFSCHNPHHLWTTEPCGDGVGHGFISNTEVPSHTTLFSSNNVLMYS